jgi:hypothetical protein
MPKPTQAALQKKPAAVVMLSSLKDTPDVVGDYDFEWFETPEGRAEFWANLQAWATEDVKDHGDVLYVMVNLSDTKDFTVEDVLVFAAADTVDDTWKQARIDAIKADGTLAVAPAVTRKGNGGGKPPAKKVVKPRQKSAADDAVKGPVKAGNEPKQKVRKPAKKADAGTAKSAPKPRNARAAALKERLAQKVPGGDESVLAGIDAELASPAMGFQINLR